MRVILDECLPRGLAKYLIDHQVVTVPQAGFAGFTNGELLRRIDGTCDAFVTVDRNLPAQNTLATHSFGVIVLRAQSNRLAALTPLVPDVLAALATLRAGNVVIVSE